MNKARWLGKAEDVAFQTVLSAAIAGGHVDPTGKSDQELLAEFLSWLKRVPAGGISISLDHRPDILSEARRFLRARRPHLACLLFATWTEHWVNALIDVRCRRLRVRDDDRKEMIRAISLNSKLSWLLRLLGARSLGRQHVARMLAVADLRNAFVHYKWSSIDDDVNVSPDAALMSALDQYQGTVRYLQRYEARVVRDSSSRRVGQLARGRRGRANQALQPTPQSRRG